MPYSYINYFNVHKDDVDGKPVSFRAATDTNPLGTDTGGLGDMKVSELGFSKSSADGPPIDDGFYFSFQNVASQRASQTIYVVDPVALLALNNRLNAAGTLFAEVEFDSPWAATADGTSINEQTPWAVGVNFKTGDENDGSDTFIGPTCQFVQGGNINFNFTNSNQSRNGTYGGFGGGPTKFKLSVAVRRTPTSFDAGGMLFLDGEPVFFGSILDPGFGFLSNAKMSKQVITAAGVAIVIKGKDMAGNSLPAAQISVRLTAFRLFWGDLLFNDEIRIPLIKKM